MADEVSDRLALPLLHAGQAQKEIFHNEALIRLDMLVQGKAESADLAAPPASPLRGQCWIVAASATGAWAGHEGSLAAWTAGGWRFALPVEGMEMWVGDRSHRMEYRGGAWEDAAVREDGLYVAGERVVAAQQPAIADVSGGSAPDAEARAAVNEILAMLRLHGLIAAP